jgi:hypothetical protein
MPASPRRQRRDDLPAIMNFSGRRVLPPCCASSPDRPPAASGECATHPAHRAAAEEAAAYNRNRVATATVVALYRDDHLDDAMYARDSPYSVPSPETRAAICATLAVLEADYTDTP